jgi:thioredoxin reductase (NADPH)
LPRLIIIGSGPAGLTAGIYATRAGVETKIVEGGTPGGQLMFTGEVENYPGFPEPVMGPELMAQMRKQVERLGVNFIPGSVTGVDFAGAPFQVTVGKTAYEADSVIVATGASPRWLGLESEQRLRGKGVSACATCDGFFFKGKDVVVVGGGDTAVEDAIYLSNIARSVALIHRRAQLRATKVIQDRAFKKEKINFLWNSVVEDILGEKKVEGVKIKDLKTGRGYEHKCDGVFIAVGYVPNTEIFKAQLELDEAGYIKVRDKTRTNREGVFAAGDVVDRVYRQAITAAGSGCQAAMDAIRYMESQTAR